MLDQIRESVVDQALAEPQPASKRDEAAGVYQNIRSLKKLREDVAEACRVIAEQQAKEK